MHSSIEKQQSLVFVPSQIILGVVLLGMALAALAGCGFSGPSAPMQGAVALRGTVHGGDKAVSGAKVQLYSAGTAGIGSTAIPLLNNPVDTDSDGNFVIPALYECPSASSQLYVIARGGSPGLPSGRKNPAIALTTMLGACDSLSASSAITVNEVTTVGSVWPLAPYMKSAIELGAPAGDSNFLTAALSVNKFIKIAQGTSPGTATPESYFVQNAKLNSLADVLDKCVNSAGGSAGDGTPCGSLFAMTTPASADAPTDTISAAMHIAQSPYSEVAAIYGLTGAPAAFQPNLAAVPPDWTLVLSHPVAAPAISLSTGSYIGSQTISISDSTAGSTVYYTTDGTLPTRSSTVYSGPILITATSTVQAIAIEGISQSALASSTLTITSPTPAQTPAKLAFLQGPSNALMRVAISPAIRVVVEDASGNVVASATNLIRVNLSGVYGLGGTLRIAARKGVATFNDLTVSTAGSYTLTASSPGLESIGSIPFTISAPPIISVAAKLVFLQQPSNALVGATIKPPVRVGVEDAHGNIVTSANNPVIIALAGATGLTGTLSANPLNGVATFGDLAILSAGAGYMLTATSPGMPAANSVHFDISPPVVTTGMAAKLAFLQQPTSGSTRTEITPAVTVALEDTNGNIVSSASVPVTLSLQESTATLNGPVTVATINGLATFSALSINTAAAGYILSATSPGLPPATSKPFTMSTPVTATAVAAQAADAFVDSVGLNVHFSYYGSVYTSQTPQMLSYIKQLGIRHLRDQMAWQGTSPSSDFYTVHNRLGAMGVKTDYILTSIDYSMAQVAAYPGLVSDMEAAEAANEYDAAGDPSWPANIRAQQSALYDQIHSSQATRNMTVIAPSLAQPQNASQLGDVSSISNAGNSHAYFGGWNPGNSGTGGENNPAYFMRLALVNAPSKPVWVTENGYWSIQAPYYGGSGVGEALMATYMPRALLEFWMAGVSRNYIYELADYSDTDYFGLLRQDGSPKPALFAVSNLLTLLNDPGPALTPGSLSYSITGASSQLQSVLFQKRDGSFYLALWVEAAGMNGDTRAAITVPSQTIQLRLAKFPATVTNYQWNSAGTMTTTPLNASQAISVSVSPNITVLRIQ